MEHHRLWIKTFHPDSEKVNMLVGHDVARHALVGLISRIRSGYSRFQHNMNKVGLSPSALCEYGAARRTTSPASHGGIGRVGH